MVERQVGGVNVLRNAVHGLIGFVAPAVVVLASYPVLIRHLGTTAFGVYLLAMSMGGAVMLLDLGFSAATLRFVAQDLAAGRAKAAADVVATSLVFYGGIGAIGALIIEALAPLCPHLFKIDARLAADAVLVFRLAGLQFAAYMPAMVFVSIAKAAGRFDRAAIFVFLFSLTCSGCATLAVLAGAGLVQAMTAVVIANFAALAVIAFDGLRLCRDCGIRMRQARPVAFRRMLGFGWALTVNSIAGFFLYQIQRFLVGFAMGPAAVSIYQAAAVAPSKLHAAVNAASEVMFPLATVSRDRASLRRMYLRMLGASALAALAGFAGLVAFARPLLALWLGAQMAASVAPLIPVFGLAYFFLALSPAPFHLVNGMGRPGLNTLFYVANALVNVALIGAFALRGLTLMKFAWAFAASNIVTSVCYQLTVEMLIWKRDAPLPAASLSEAGLSEAGLSEAAV
ncbi:MAG TPA: oligosaccharide flippase family protein [Bryobacteraceae bacterium]|nr:oligosaccharide flippase family protein [Bryobacteraceae bacterium]